MIFQAAEAVSGWLPQCRGKWQNEGFSKCKWVRDMPDQDQTIAVNFNTEILSKVNTPATHIDLFYEGKELSFGKSDLPIQLGRDDAVCQITVDSDLASRVHCTIEVREGQIGLADSSTNGTFICIGRNESFIIKDNFYPLIGQGTIKLGEQIENNEDHTIYFRMSLKRD